MKIDSTGQYGFAGLSGEHESIHLETTPEPWGLGENELRNLSRLTSKIGFGEGGVGGGQSALALLTPEEMGLE